MTAWQELKMIYAIKRVNFPPSQALKLALKGTRGKVPF